MIEGFAREMPEDQMARGHCRSATASSSEICDLQHELFAKVDVAKEAVRSSARRRPVRASSRARYYDALQARPSRPSGKQARADAVAALKEQVDRRVDSRSDGRRRDSAAMRFVHAWHELEEQVVRDLILSGTRPDGRDTQDAAGDRVPGRRAAARARLGRVPARRDAGADHRHAGHRPRRAARRRPDRRVLEEVHARLQLPAVLGRRSAARSAARAGARSATARWPSAASSRCCPIRKSFPTRSA